MKIFTNVPQIGQSISVELQLKLKYTYSTGQKYCTREKPVIFYWPHVGRF